MSVPGDVTAEGFASKIVKATIDEYGALHILVNNAGQLLCSSTQTCFPHKAEHLLSPSAIELNTALSTLHCYSQTTKIMPRSC